MTETISHVTVRPDSIEIGTPSKRGGVVKIYLDFGDPVDSERRIHEAFRLREIAQGLHEKAAA
jgi:hypothetical protein